MPVLIQKYQCVYCKTIRESRANTEKCETECETRKNKWQHLRVSGQRGAVVPTPDFIFVRDEMGIEYEYELTGPRQ